MKALSASWDWGVSARHGWPSRLIPITEIVRENAELEEGEELTITQLSTPEPIVAEIHDYALD